jgi:hypothetical protein
MHRIINAVRGNLVAWLALFVALGGTSLAASHYIITSTTQIKPSVRRALHGAEGAQGPQGPAGPQGPQGGEANLAKLCAAIQYSAIFVAGEKTYNALTYIWNQGCH